MIGSPPSKYFVLKCIFYTLSYPCRPAQYFNTVWEYSVRERKYMDTRPKVLLVPLLNNQTIRQRDPSYYVLSCSRKHMPNNWKSEKLVFSYPESQNRQWERLGAKRPWITHNAINIIVSFNTVISVPYNLEYVTLHYKTSLKC